MAVTPSTSPDSIRTTVVEVAVPYQLSSDRYRPPDVCYTPSPSISTPVSSIARVDSPNKNNLENSNSLTPEIGFKKWPASTPATPLFEDDQSLGLSKHHFDTSDRCVPPLSPPTRASPGKIYDCRKDQGPTYTRAELLTTYHGKDPWVSAAKEEKLLMLGCQWHLVRAGPGNIADMKALRQRIEVSITGFFDRIPHSNAADFGYDIIVIWDGEKKKYTTLDDHNLHRALELLQIEARFSWFQIVPSGMLKPKPLIPRSPEQSHQRQEGTNAQDPLRKPDPGLVASAISNGVEIPLTEMLEICWQAFLAEDDGRER
ncbi:MAG: hypothetical protein Q9159_006486 [Coniocarpon cinnabarinum]